MEFELPIEVQVHVGLQQLLGFSPSRDSDGDWPVRIGRTVVFVSPQTAPAQHAFIFAGVAPSLNEDCLGELNDLNAAAAWSKFIRAPGGAVYTVQRIPLVLISSVSLGIAMRSVAECAETAGPMLAAVFGPAVSETGL